MSDEACENRVLGVVGEPISAVGYVRFQQPFAHLARHGFRLSTLGRSLDLVRNGARVEPPPSLLDGVTLVIFPQMVASPVLPDGTRVDLVEPICERARRAGARIVYSVDDWLPAIESSNPGHQRIRDSYENLRKILDAADAIVATTDSLADSLRHLGKPIHVLPNAVDPPRWKMRPRRPGAPRLGWAGSSSHVEDLRMVVPAIRRLQQRVECGFAIHGLVDRPLDEEVCRVRGMLRGLSGSRRDTAESFLALAGELKKIDYTHVPFTTIEAYFESLGALDLDVGICPLRDTEFNRHKSALKFYEYATVGTLTVASDVTPYREEVSLTVPDDAAAWGDTLERYLRDARAREAELERQRAFVLEQRDIRRLSDRWAGALREILGSGSTVGIPGSGARAIERPARPAGTAVPTGAAGPPNAANDPRRRVTAVMLTCGQWKYTRRCLRSLRPDLDAGMELVVVDNASDDETPARLRTMLEPFERVRIVESPFNLGFAAGCNRGTLAAAPGNDLLYINNDVVAPEGWLGRLLDHLRAEPAVALIGPRSNRISGHQQLPVVDYDEESLHGFTGFAERLAESNAGCLTLVERIVGFCMLVRREAIDRIGGFDPRFGLGNFEDDDFCVRAALAGFGIAQAEDVLVHHFGGRTFSGQKIDRNRSVLRNWELFKKKWGLPANRSLQAFYSRADFRGIAFDGARHRIPLESYLPEPLRLEQRRGFNFLLIADPAASAWEQTARNFLCTFRDADDVALLLRGDPPERTGAMLERVEALLRELGVAIDRCASVVGVDLPLLPEDEARLFSSADALLVARGGLAEHHRQFAALTQCPVMDDPAPWALRAAAAGRVEERSEGCRSNEPVSKIPA